jgi:hypothetical protein
VVIKKRRVQVKMIGRYWYAINLNNFLGGMVAKPMPLVSYYSWVVSCTDILTKWDDDMKKALKGSVYENNSTTR